MYHAYVLLYFSFYLHYDILPCTLEQKQGIFDFTYKYDPEEYYNWFLHRFFHILPYIMMILCTLDQKPGIFDFPYKYNQENTRTDSSTDSPIACLIKWSCIANISSAYIGGMIYLCIQMTGSWTLLPLKRRFTIFSHRSIKSINSSIKSQRSYRCKCYIVPLFSIVTHTFGSCQ